ncbi:MAG TPA: TRAM domain-containing protein [Candidatus Saccharimonadales bacterium]|jgi:23S rRNA (uracil1939-C5)-methyltransferase
MEEVTIQKLVHGGQGLAELADGRKVFVWNALPGETVRVRIIKKKRSYAEAIAEEIVQASPDRVAPREENYLATSPWQMMTFAAENQYKAEIVGELFAHEKVELAGSSISSPLQAVGRGKSLKQFSLSPPFQPLRSKNMDNPARLSAVHTDVEWHYRNKMEYSFWGDEDGLHLALHRRGSHGKQIVTGSKLALPALDAGARAVLAELRKTDMRAGDLKTIVVRCGQNGDVVAALYTKVDDLPKISLPAEVKGLRAYYSNPQSPASVPTRLLYELGDATLQDSILDRPFTYDVESFFQVNLPIYEKALTRIREHCAGDPVDMYAGVGSIGLSVAKSRVELVELDPATAKMARLNAAAETSLDTKLIEASTEKALECIVPDRPVIFDPPRAGLHAAVVERCLEVLPLQIIYLSCNPATQARDLAFLQAKYTIDFFEVYNFFPKTPHIETLAILKRK